jgi:hypothetical protein
MNLHTSGSAGLTARRANSNGHYAQPGFIYV